VIALAVLAGRIAAAEAWAAAHVDEDWNMDSWGRDALALERRAFHLCEMKRPRWCSSCTRPDNRSWHTVHSCPHEAERQGALSASRQFNVEEICSNLSQVRDECKAMKALR